MAHHLLLLSREYKCHKKVTGKDALLAQIIDTTSAWSGGEHDMPVEPPRKITETQIIRREEGTALDKRKKPFLKKNDQKKEPDKSGKVDIKI